MNLQLNCLTAVQGSDTTMTNIIPNACSTMCLLYSFVPLASLPTSTNLLISPLYTKLARQTGLFETDI